MGTTDIERQRKHFESISERYFESRKDLKHLFLKKTIWEYFFSAIDLPAKERLMVLEAMCGYAESYSILSAHIGDVFIFNAFDYSSAMVEFAQKKCPGANIWEQDVTTFCQPDSYNIIFVIGGLHHVYQHAKVVMDNLGKSLCKGGLLINLEPTHNNVLFSAIRKLVYWKNSFFDEKTECGFTTKELNAMAKGSGMSLVRQIYPGLLAYVLWYNPDAFPCLNRGSLKFAEAIILKERSLWNTALGRLFSFATLSCYRKD